MPAPSDLQKARIAVCNQCPELTTVGMCRKCGCIMALKVKLKGGRCPMGKWPDAREWMNKPTGNC